MSACMNSYEYTYVSVYIYVCINAHICQICTYLCLCLCTDMCIQAFRKVPTPAKELSLGRTRTCPDGPRPRSRGPVRLGSSSRRGPRRSEFLRSSAAWTSLRGPMRALLMQYSRTCNYIYNVLLDTCGGKVPIDSRSDMALLYR